jgi:hypothetical protein
MLFRALLSPKEDREECSGAMRPWLRLHL